MIGIFGWSYPPGCSGPPCEDDPPCEVCGEWVDDCICPECSCCDVQGDPACYAPAPHGHGMVRTLAQDHGAALREDEYWQQAQADREGAG
jgi:hypothetical protein